MSVISPLTFLAPTWPPEIQSFAPERVRGDTSSETPRWTDLLVQFIGAVMPDAIVYANTFSLTAPNNKSFLLINPAAVWTDLSKRVSQPGQSAQPSPLPFTQYIAHPQSQKSVMRTNFFRVESIQYGGAGGTRREDGIGTGWDIGRGIDKGRIFINSRAGDTNGANSNNGLSVNFGFYGPPVALRQLIDRLPSNGRFANIKAMLEATIRTASIGGTQIGLAWRATIQTNHNTGASELNLSGWKIPLSKIQEAVKLQGTEALNYGSKPLAVLNNEEAYLHGANPFQRAADDGSPSAGFYPNHGDPVSAIAGHILWLERSLEGGNAIRTNDAAQKLILQGINKQDTLDPQQRAHLESLLATLHDYDYSFNSYAIQAYARGAAERIIDVGQGLPAGGSRGENKQRRVPPASDREFLRNVFTGVYRREFQNPYDAGAVVKDLSLGVNRWLATAFEVFDPKPVAADDIYLLQRKNITEGFHSRISARYGGVLKALRLLPKSAFFPEKAERSATGLLVVELEKNLHDARQKVTAQSLYEGFLGLSATKLKTMTATIQSRLNNE